MNSLTNQKPLNVVMCFGKYNGRSMAWIAEHDPQYLMWIGPLPVVRSRCYLWSFARGHLLEVLQADLNQDRFGDLA